jgi:phosphoglycolate phosphatase
VYDAVIFDLDGVLIDSRAAFTRSFNHALETNGLPAEPPESLYRFIGPPLESNFAILLDETGGDAALIPALVAAYRERYSAMSATETVLYDGVRELLDAIEVPMAIATLKPGPLARPLMAALGIADHFVAIEGPALADADETKDVTVRRALARLGDPDPTRVPFVGDRATDVAAAKLLGLPSIAAQWGMGSETELAGADAFASTPAEVLRLLTAG